MLSIQLSNLGKNFNKEWIFRNLSYQINPNDKIVILGGNGSGKSTLLQVISGFITENEGDVIYKLNDKIIPVDKIKNYISFASPYIHLIEEFTLTEMIDHTKIFKPFVNDLSTEQIIELIDLTKSKNKLIKQFSSGMKQRLKLGVAILCDTPVLLLDEPISNLDANAIDWYKKIVKEYSKNRTVIVASNAIQDEFFICDKQLNVADFKPSK
ncbi:MAG: ATP-binding cassette domain-containing protein [Bacteroidota bacterium]|nr:ATP-binding cassette domain-containing protein [Bacteroidota bacterium]MDP3146365.1 ATP-binding cassette domain-containing protein [Bacteroidota bacterium]